MTRMMPGPELDAAVAEKMTEYDRWELEQRSKGCHDASGAQLSKPPQLLAGAHSRWLEEWSKLMMRHNRVCVRCSQENPEP